MKLKWTRQAYADLGRLYEFLAPLHQPAAVRTMQVLASAPTGLLENPRMGTRLKQFDPREVRRILVGSYELRYEIQEGALYVLRVWHTREDR